MKKGFIAVLAIVALLGCKKESAPQAPSTSLSAQQQVEQLTEEFLAATKPGNMSTKIPKWLKILGTDGKNAVIGAGIGAGIGTGVGGPGAGTAIGATIGGVIMGACASLEAAGAAPAAQPAVTMANPSNPYDYTGELHYDLMEGSFANPAIVSPDGEINFDNFHGFAFQLVTEAVPGAADVDLSSGITAAYLQQQLQTLNPNQSLSNFIGTAPASVLTQQEKLVLIPYCNALDHISGAQQFASYSINVENVVVNSASFSAQQKQRMLIFMATMRHGAYYYGL